MFRHAEQQQQRDVVVTSTAAAAEFVATTLSVHGIRATTAAYSGVYPSVDWVEGFRVTVAADDEARAREVLAALAGRRDIAQIPPG